MRQHADVAPSPHSPNPDFAASRMLWALTEETAMQFFAHLDPVPPLEWLEVFARNRFGHNDLSRFGVAPQAEQDPDFDFSMVQRPSPYTLAPQMGLTGNECGQWDGIMHNLVCWLTRHLDDPRLVLWLARQGGPLHPQWARMIKNRFSQLDFWQEDNEQEPNQLRQNAPNAIPSRKAYLRKLWQLILAGRLKPFYTTE